MEKKYRTYAKKFIKTKVRMIFRKFEKIHIEKEKNIGIT